MLVGYVTVKETSEKWNINPRALQIMCKDGWISKEKKFGKAWAIPADIEKSTGKRIVSEEYVNWRKKEDFVSE